MKPIYIPSGAAKEYGDYALNIYTVYIHTFTNGKKYVGLTKDLKHRFRNGKGYERSPRIWNAIQKYGWKSVTTEIIATGLSSQEAKTLEIEYIKRFKTTEQLYGYNTTLGGEGANGRKLTLEQKRAIGERMSKANKGKKLSEEHKLKLSKIRRGRKAITTPEVCQKRKEIWADKRDVITAKQRLALYNRYGIIPTKFDLRDDAVKIGETEYYAEFDYNKNLLGGYSNPNLFKP